MSLQNFASPHSTSVVVFVGQFVPKVNTGYIANTHFQLSLFLPLEFAAHPTFSFQQFLQQQKRKLYLKQPRQVQIKDWETLPWRQLRLRFV
jgi:hypothetical protein